MEHESSVVTPHDTSTARPSPGSQAADLNTSGTFDYGQLIFSLAVNLGLLMLSWSGVAMAIGSRSRRRSVAGALAGLLALAAFLLDYVARAWQPAQAVAWLSPFRYYSPFDLLMGNALPARNLLVLAGIAVAGFAAAYLLFAHRDISH
jgi:ABC-2 type transport system permease protein